MYICNGCGQTFEEFDTDMEDRGEYLGTPCTEEVVFSPCCADDFEEAKECSCCGEFFKEEELTNSICEDCGEYCNTCDDFVDKDDLTNGTCDDCLRMEDEEEGGEEDDTE